MLFDMQGFDPYIGAIGAKTKKKLQRVRDIETANILLDRCINDCIGRYQIDGITATMDKRTILLSLLCYGNIVFFKPKNGGGICSLPGTPTEGLNIYGRPGMCYLFAPDSSTGYNVQASLYIPGSGDEALLDKYVGDVYPGEWGEVTDAMIVFESPTRIPLLHSLIQYVERACNAIKAIDYNSDRLRVPYMVIADKTLAPTVKMFFDAKDQGEQYVVGNGRFDPSQIAVLPTYNTVDHIREAVSLLEFWESRAKMLAGIPVNAQSDKKGENLTTDEIHMTDLYSESIVDNTVEYLNEQFKEVNEHFGTNLRARRTIRNKDNSIQNDKKNISPGEQTKAEREQEGV